MRSTDWDRVNLPPLGLLWTFGGWWRWLILALALAGVAAMLRHPVLGLGSLLCAAGLTWFFRNPTRAVAAHPVAVVSPVDGVVDDLGIADGSPWIRGEALRIGIFLSVLDVHATRAPITGTVRETRSMPGAHRNAISPKTGATNRRNEIRLSDPTGGSVILRQIAGAVARRVVFAPRPGDTVHAGAVVGMIRFGSRVELWLPVEDGYIATVWRGEKVRSGVSVLAQARTGSRPPARR